MSMLAGVILVAGALLGTGPAPAAPASVAARTSGVPVVARSADVPAEFGSDWHDPVTARRQARRYVL